MVNLKIARYNGVKTFKEKLYHEYTLLDEKGYTFNILTVIKAPEDMPYLPVMICSYKGQPKIRVCTEQVQEYINIE